MVGTLEKAIGEKLENPLRRHLIEQCQGLPWLLKKFCVHIYRKLKEGVSQRELIGNQLDAKTLFIEDTQTLSTEQTACLKYIALNSPADIVDVHEKYGSKTPDLLYANRLIVKSGARYMVYWDIFKEFLITNNVPNIPVTYVPQSQVTTALSVFKYIRDKGPVDVDSICKAFNYTIKTVWNITGDLSSFFMTERIQTDKLVAVDGLDTSSDLQIANHLANELSRHIVYMLFRSRVQPNQSLWRYEVHFLFSEVYPSATPETLHSYFNRLLPWFQFSGLVEENEYGNIIRPVIEAKGKQKGKIIKRRSTLNDGQPVFVSSASPRRVVDLAVNLCRFGVQTRAEVEGSSNRNAALDLSALGLATWNNTKLLPLGALLSISQNFIEDDEELHKKCYELVKNAAINSKFITILSSELLKSNDMSDEQLAETVMEELNRDWLPESAIRYLNAGKSWMRFFGYLDKLRGQQSFYDYGWDEFE